MDEQRYIDPKNDMNFFPCLSITCVYEILKIISTSEQVLVISKGVVKPAHALTVYREID